MMAATYDLVGMESRLTSVTRARLNAPYLVGHQVELHPDPFQKVIYCHTFLIIFLPIPLFLNQ